jgi:hypothetical protein
MGVRTTADEKIDSAREHVRLAVEDLAQVVIAEVWGWDEFTPERQKSLEEALDCLRTAKKALR